MEMKGIDKMIFYVVGWILFVLGILFKIFPSKNINRLYGYRSFRAEESLETWRYAQKVSSWMLLLVGAIGIVIGFVLKKMGWTNYFLIELLLLVFLIVPIFIVTEEKLKKHQQGQKK